MLQGQYEEAMEAWHECRDAFFALCMAITPITIITVFVQLPSASSNIYICRPAIYCVTPISLHS